MIKLRDMPVIAVSVCGSIALVIGAIVGAEFRFQKIEGRLDIVETRVGSHSHDMDSSIENRIAATEKLLQETIRDLNYDKVFGSGNWTLHPDGQLRIWKGSDWVPVNVPNPFNYSLRPEVKK